MDTKSAVRAPTTTRIGNRLGAVNIFGLGLLGFLQFLPVPDAANRASACGCGFSVSFTFTFDPKTAELDLLPVPPKSLTSTPGLLINDLSQVPEIALHEPLLADPEIKNIEKWAEERRVKFLTELLEGKHKNMADLAHTAAKIRHLNRNKEDRFVELLIAHRPDLQGLPFVLGKACRMPEPLMRSFAQTVTQVHATIGNDSAGFWDRFPTSKLAPNIAALTQMLATESTQCQCGLVNHLAKQPQIEATRTLARMAIFAVETEVRTAAIDAMRTRDVEDYTAIILSGLHYPWPAVAQRAADALAKLDRTDLVHQLIEILDEPDPRAPVIVEKHGKKSFVVRELVRINHHRNCLLCHPPAAKVQSRDELDSPLVGSIPVPDFPLPSSGQGYGFLSPDMLVRADATYLRQDFSMMQKVADSVLWPEMQRFDFLARTRVLDSQQESILRKALARPENRTVYRDATLAALRKLTSADAGTTAEAWRGWLVSQVAE